MTAAQRRPRVLAAVVLGCLFGLLATGTASTAGASSASDSIASLANDARRSDGLAPLARNAALDAVALDWAKQMASNGNLSHNPNVSSQIPDGWRRVGENVAQGYQSPRAMHQGWMGSSGHRANMLGDYTDIGVAFYRTGGTTWGVQVFASYPGGSDARVPSPTAASPSATPPDPTTAAPTTAAPRKRRTTEPSAPQTSSSPKATTRPRKTSRPKPSPSSAATSAADPTPTGETAGPGAGGGSDDSGTTVEVDVAPAASEAAMSRPMAAGALALAAALTAGLAVVIGRRRRAATTGSARHRG